MFRIWLVLFSIFITYTLFVYTSCDKANPGAIKPDQKVLAGWKLWQANNCHSCHQVYGLGGYLGPDLTNVAADPLKDERYLGTFIKYGTGRMPNFHFNDEEVSNLISFLGWVNKSGKSRVAAESVTWTGTYNIEN